MCKVALDFRRDELQRIRTCSDILDSGAALVSLLAYTPIVGSERGGRAGRLSVGRAADLSCIVPWLMDCPGEGFSKDE